MISMNFLNNPDIGTKKNISKRSNALEKKKLFTQNGKYNIVQLKSHLMDQGVLANEDIKEMIDKFSKLIYSEPNLCEVNGNVTIIGDIHGQYFDFMKILTQLGNFQQNVTGTLLFLGDYVDRGSNSVEVMTLIMALKFNYPKNIILLRGNHQSRCMTSLYNFLTETNNKYNQDVYQMFMVAFDNLPLACLVNKSLFCVHGGLSAHLVHLKDVNKIDRYTQIPLEGQFCDLIWSDPVSNESGEMSSDAVFNDSRQCSIYFGKSLAKKFLQENSLRTIVRAHEVFPEGYKRYGWGLSKSTDFPSIITIFSAPNYCGVYGNKGAILKVQNGTHQIKQYKQQSVHKLYKYLEVLQWSIPLLTDVINDFTKAMMSSIFHIYLKPDFQKFQKQSPEAKLSVLMNYIKTNTNIVEQQTKRSEIFRKKEEESHGSKMSKHNVGGNEKQRLFNRSYDYFSKEEQRPDSKIHKANLDPNKNQANKQQTVYRKTKKP